MARPGFPAPGAGCLVVGLFSGVAAGPLVGCGHQSGSRVASA
ncbi:hypothetical protein [Nocardia wallacei]|nr:hypothetical protein [Nocardia wallacei]